MLACKSAQLPAPTDQLESALQMLDAELGAPSSTECVGTRQGGGLVRGQMEKGREYCVIQGDEVRMVFRFEGEMPPNKVRHESFCLATDMATGKQRSLYFADIGLEPYGSIHWSTCRVVNSELDSVGARQLLDRLSDDENIFSPSPGLLL